MARDISRDAVRRRIQQLTGSGQRSSEPRFSLPNVSSLSPVGVSRYSQTPPTREEAGAGPTHYGRPEGPSQPSLEGPTHYGRPESAPEPSGPTHYGRPSGAPSPSPTGQIPVSSEPQTQEAPQEELSPYGQPLTGPVPEEQWDDIIAANPELAERIRDAYINQYGIIPGGDVSVVSLVNKIVNEGYPEEEIFKLIERGYNVPELIADASGLVNARLNPQEQAINQAIEAIERQRAQDIAEQKAYREALNASLGDIWGDAAEFSQGIASQISDLWGGVGEGVQGAYDAASGNVSDALQAAIESISQNAGQLGIETAMPEVTGELTSEIIPEVGSIEQMGANYLQNAIRQGAIEQTYQNRQSDLTNLRGADAQTRLAAEVAAAIGDIQTQSGEALIEQQQALVDLGNLRGDELRATITELENIRHQQGMEEARLALEEMETEARVDSLIQSGELERAGLDLERERLDLERILGLGDLDLRAQLINAQVDEIAARVESIGADADLTRATIERILSEVGLNEAQIEETLANVGLIEASTDQTEAEIAQIETETSLLGEEESEEELGLIEAAQTGDYQGFSGVQQIISDYDLSPELYDVLIANYNLAESILTAAATGDVESLLDRYPHLSPAYSEEINRLIQYANTQLSLGSASAASLANQIIQVLPSPFVADPDLAVGGSGEASGQVQYLPTLFEILSGTFS